MIASDLVQLQPFIEHMDQATKNKLLASWPGPVTWLLPAHRLVSPLLRGRHRTIAVRVTAHPIAAMLCDALGHKLREVFLELNSIISSLRRNLKT